MTMFQGYLDKSVSLLTKHGKERVIGQEIGNHLGMRLVHVDNFDTDYFGSFTRDIPRTGDQYQAAYAKAKKGMELAGLKMGMASEGSFSKDPYAGMIPWNKELIVFLDEDNEIEVVGTSSNYAQCYSATITRNDDLEMHLQKAFFPSHHLVVRLDHPESTIYTKGVSSREALEDVLKEYFQKSQSGQVYIENDLRAFANPTRMENIRVASLDLIQKLSSCCPSCGIPGFWIDELIPGLICEQCGHLTREIKARVYACKKCSHQEVVNTDRNFAKPMNCEYCNP
jgi:hypothetical protein